MTITRRSGMAVLGSLFFGTVLLAGIHAAEKPSGDTVVYHLEGKNRVHVANCRRFPKDPAEREKFTKMTLTEAEEKGLQLCSKCPGSTTPGREKD